MFLPKWYFQFRPPYKYDEQYYRVTRTSYGFSLTNAVIFVKPEMYGNRKCTAQESATIAPIN